MSSTSQQSSDKKQPARTSGDDVVDSCRDVYRGEFELRDIPEEESSPSTGDRDRADQCTALVHGQQQQQGHKTSSSSSNSATSSRHSRTDNKPVLDIVRLLELANDLCRPLTRCGL